MSRQISSTLNQILNASKYEIDWTLDLYFPDNSVLRYATSPIVANSINYTNNDIEVVGEILQTLERPVNSVNIAIQNKDNVLGSHVRNNPLLWRKANAVLGRFYRDGDGLNLSAWIEMFRGVVQKPQTNDFQVVFDLIPDTTAPGQIVCNRTLSLTCGYVFKDPKTCRYAGAETVCNHLLKSSGGCDGHNNALNFGGMEHRYLPIDSVPGTAGNDGNIGTGGGLGCPRLDQFILVKGKKGKGTRGKVAKRVGELSVDDLIYNPISDSFHRIKSLEVMRDVPIWITSSSQFAITKTSFSHRQIETVKDSRGRTISEFVKGNRALNFIDGFLRQAQILASFESKESGDVLKIEMADGHIYCCGDKPEKMSVAHNSKNPFDIEV